MLAKICGMLTMHVKNNINTYFLLLLAFIVGVSSGAFTVNGLSSLQIDELTNYLQGFLKLFDSQGADRIELFKIALADNFKIVALLWALGVTIIGIPFIFVIIGIKGFITGFCSGFVIKTVGLKGILFMVSSVLLKEIIIVPCLIALGVNGVNFSLNIIRKKSISSISKENLKKNFLAYCFVTFFYSCFIFAAILLEAYVVPVFIKLTIPVIVN